VLDDSLARCPQRKVIFTNAPSCHASRVLQCLGVETHFEKIFDIRFTSYQPKPYPQPYRNHFLPAEAVPAALPECPGGPWSRAPKLRYGGGFAGKP
jgi:putative hydrolase of the HAD superfamily